MKTGELTIGGYGRRWLQIIPHWKRLIFFSSQLLALVIADSGSPSPVAKSLSSTWHPGYTGDGYDSTGLTRGGKDTNYLRSLASLSAIVIACGTLAIVVYLAILCARRTIWKTWEFSRFSIGFTYDSDTYRLRSKGSRPVRFLMICGFGITAIAMLEALGASFEVNSATRTAATATSHVARSFAEMETNSSSLADSDGKLASALSTAATEAGCVDGILANELGTLQERAAIVQQQTTGTGGTMGAVNMALVDPTSNQFVVNFIGVTSTVVVIATMVGATAAILSSSTLMTYASGGSVCALSLLVIALGLVVSIGVELGDYCIKPTTNALALVDDALVTTDAETSAQVRGILQYFITCEGENPLLQDSDSLIGAASALKSSVEDDANACVQGSILSRAIEREVSSKVSGFDEAIDCVSVQTQYLNAIREQLCVRAIESLEEEQSFLVATFAIFWCILVFSAFVNLEKTDAELQANDADTPTSRARRRRMLAEKRRKIKRQEKARLKTRQLRYDSTENPSENPSVQNQNRQQDQAQMPIQEGNGWTRQQGASDSSAEQDEEVGEVARLLVGDDISDEYQDAYGELEEAYVEGNDEDNEEVLV